MTSRIPGLALLTFLGACNFFGSNPEPQTYASFVGKDAHNYCKQRARCGGIGISEIAACADEAVAGGTSSVDEAIAAGRVAFDEEAARACLDEGRVSFCSYLGAVPDSPCDHVLVGLVANGGACRSWLECREGWCGNAMNKLVQDGCPGTCRAFAAPGTPCDGMANQCDGASRCHPMTGRCVLLLGAGEPCHENVECQYGFSCDNSACTPWPYLPGRMSAGASCRSLDDCQDNLACIGLRLTMDRMAIEVPGVCSPFLDLGSHCDPDVFESGCPRDMACDPATSTCKPAGGPGQPCVYRQCNGLSDWNLYCDRETMTCKTRVGLGLPCVPSQTVCASGTCDPGTKTCQRMCM